MFKIFIHPSLPSQNVVKLFRSVRTDDVQPFQSMPKPWLDGAKLLGTNAAF